MAFPIAIQLYSVREEAEANLRGTLQTLKTMGYDGVEFAGLYGHSPAEVKALCQEIGLDPVSAHVPLPDLLSDPVGVLTTYREIGCRYVAVPYLPEALRPGMPNFIWVIEFIRTLCRVAKTLGLQMLYHNHDFEFISINGKYGLTVLYESIPADLLQTELDTCWVNVAGEDPAAFVRTYAGRAPVVHIKDFYGEKTERMYELIGTEQNVPTRPSGFEFRPVGQGLQNIPELLSASKDAGATWIVVEQDMPSMGLTPLECAEQSILYLKSIGASPRMEDPSCQKR